MADSPENRGQVDLPERDTDTKPGESLALPYDPAAMKPAHRFVTSPLKPFYPPRPPRSPVWIMVLSAGIILGAIILGVLLASVRRDVGSAFQSQNPENQACMLVANQDANVRIGPGFEYARNWILPRGQSEEASARIGKEWFRIDDGWLPSESVNALVPAACSALPQTNSINIFSDKFDLPPEVAALNWLEILDENFATDVNGWVESADGVGVGIEKGYLEFSAAAKHVFPEDSPNFYTLSDAYYTFSLQWIAGDSPSEMMLRFQTDGENGYYFSVSSDGVLILGETEASSDQQLAQGTVQFGLGDLLFIGVLKQGQTIAVYNGYERILEAQSASLRQGSYVLTLHGESAQVRLSRFEVWIPPAS